MKRIHSASLTAAVFGFLMATTVTSSSFADGAKKAKDAKRGVAEAPIEAVGMPILPSSGGSGMPPGALGMPMPEDHSCRRAAGTASVNEALDDIENASDCQAESIDTVKLNKQYTVTVNCGDAGSKTYKVKVHQTTAGCVASHPKEAKTK